MIENGEIYTYRAGQKVHLDKKSDEIIVRLNPEELEQKLGFTRTERVSPSSTRVRMNSDEMETALSRARDMAIAHHAYSISNTHQDFSLQTGYS